MSDLNPECALCDNEFGSAKLYENQHLMPLSGRVRSIDPCIAHIVAALNAGGVETVACCCGHGIKDGRIDLADGRVLWVCNKKEADIFDIENITEAVDTWVFYAGSAYEVAHYKKAPFGTMVGIYDEPPSKHIDYLNPSHLEAAVKCNNCIGNGCPVCDGRGMISNGAIFNPPPPST